MKVFFKLLFLFVSVTVFSQNFYEQQWKKVAENYQKGVYKSNLPIIQDIQQQSMKDKNSMELIKSLKAEFQIVNQTQDDTKNDAASQYFGKLQKLQKTLSGNQGLVYQVLLNEFISEYYNNHSWEINQRTNINNQDLSQIETWSKLDFKNYLGKSYQDLEKQEPTLHSIKMEDYKSIFQSTQDLEFFPSLYDWFATKYIAYLQNGQLFTKNELKENQPKILALYQNLVNQNTGNAKLYFLHHQLLTKNGFTNTKTEIKDLEALVNSPTEGDYKVMIVEQMANQLIAEKKYKEALAKIDSAKKAYPKSKFLNNLLNLENSIKNPQLVLRFETTTQANKPIHLSAQYKNLEHFSVNIYEVKEDYTNYLRYIYNSYDNQFFDRINKKLVRKEAFDLKEKSYDFKKSSLEIKPLSSGLYVGEYLVDGQSQGNFYFLVSNSRLVYQKQYQNQDSKNVMKLIDRENGKIIPKENLEFIEYAQNKLVKTIGTTDAEANFQFPKSATQDYYHYFLIHQPKTNDVNLMQVMGRDYNDNIQPEKEQSQAQIFLDRAIYRPGQVVYFKVINTKLSNEKENAVAQLKQKITLQDVNGQEVSAQTFTTNEFGSYNGSFTLPNGKLNGEFSLVIDDGAVDAVKGFRVEEYKRPKFEVTFEPVKDEYQYGKTIELKGKAMMFSGVALSNTKVNYEIKKQDIRWRYFWWYPRNSGNENSILGEVKTNDKGEFTIKLDLKKDETKEGIQVDQYAINASVTDINGETQSANTNLNVASVSHYIKIEDDPASDYFTDDAVSLKVATKNYNDQSLKKSYQVKLSKLQPKERIFRDNFKNEIQDAPVLSKDEFVQKFPHDYFSKAESEPKVERVVLEKTQQPEQENPTTNNQQPATNLDLGKLPVGNYKLELYNIEGKDTIKTIKNFQVWDKKSLDGNQNTFFKLVTPKGEFSKGEKVKLYAYSAVPDASAIIYLQDGSGDTQTEIKPFRNGMLEYEVIIPANIKQSSYNIQMVMVAFNDAQTETVNLAVKSEEKPLKIETITFRDKLQPNVKEKWTIKVSGDDKEKIYAEVLANMYDKSLDQFAVNTYSFGHLSPYNFVEHLYEYPNQLAQENYSKRMNYVQNYYIQTPDFNWFDGNILGGQFAASGNIRLRGVASVQPQSAPIAMAKEEKMVSNRLYAESNDNRLSDKINAGEKLTENERRKLNDDKDGILDKQDLDKVSVRQNLNETAFFYPNLVTDQDGNVSFEFTSPEALTQWKLMFLAHTKDARSAVLEKTVVTQKDFSVTPNYPRFLREGDELNLQSKLSNLTSKPLNGSASLQILDAFTNEDISGKFNLQNAIQSFTVDQNGNTVANWKLKVPNNVSSIILKVVAKAGEFSDGEQKAIAVLPNRMLVTDALPVFVKEGQTKTFVLDALKNNQSTTAENVATTLELTTNPIWEVIFALPSLKEDTNLSADVVFNKWFADVLASEIFKANPKMKTVFEEYQSKGLLKSNLEKNQELKQLLLEETPWVLDAKNEDEQMAKIARLFDLNSMRNSIKEDWSELKKLQNADGGFSWYTGYPSSYSNSLYILKNLGKINAWLKDNVKDYQSGEQQEMVAKLVAYVDGEINKYWKPKQEEVWNNWVFDYLDTRNYWEKQYPYKNNGLTLKNLVINRAKSAKITDFTFFGLHRSALIFDQFGLKDVSKKLLTYLKETSTETETQGIYWKQNLNDWGWFTSKVVNQAGALEAFQKLTPNDVNLLEEMKIWLVTQKEVNSWGNSRSTSEVIFTILNSGKSWTSSDSDKAQVVWGGKEVTNTQTQATGYLKDAVKSNQIDKNLGEVKVTKQGAGIVQGGLFWQYYEDLDKIKSSESYISITKELYRKVKTVNGEELQKITSQTPLKVGDKVTVRMILNTDRPMQYIHLKDMRGAGFEPLDVLSGYQWKNNLGYYQSTKDASTNFYIEYMPKGKFVFEYDYVCNGSGTFSNGITTLQNYYAPQMNAHTKGDRVVIVP